MYELFKIRQNKNLQTYCMQRQEDSLENSGVRFATWEINICKNIVFLKYQAAYGILPRVLPLDNECLKLIMKLQLLICD